MDNFFYIVIGDGKLGLVRYCTDYRVSLFLHLHCLSVISVTRLILWPGLEISS